MQGIKAIKNKVILNLFQNFHLNKKQKRKDFSTKLSGITASLGFTLIELLVVVLIIAILTAAAVPMYEKSARKAQFVQVQATLTAMMRDIDTYTMENGYDTGRFTQLVHSYSCNKVDYNWNIDFCNRDEGTYWTSKSGSRIYLAFKPNPSLFATSTDSDVYSFTKAMGKPWEWSNAGEVGWWAFVTTDNETLQHLCEWWIKTGGKPVSGAAKTLAEANCKL